jgi:RNA polymerase sigma factor (sigma-70 family)
VTLTEAAIHELLQRARTGDEAAAASLIGGMRDRVFRWALVMTRDSDDAEDVAQQVSMSVHKSLNGFEARSSFSTWLYAVVRNTSAELMRKTARRKEEMLNEDVVDATLSASTNERLAAIGNQRVAAIVRAFFAELPPRQRELIELVDAEGCSAAEAARMIGIEPETARVHLLRARRTLRSKMLEAHPEMFI